MTTTGALTARAPATAGAAPTTDVLVYQLEVDVVRDRDVRPWRERTHYVTVAVDDRPNLTSADIEARNLAAWMCWHVRGSMVTAVRIVAVEL